MKIAVIGSGKVGSALARRMIFAGHEIRLSNSRGPESLTDETEQLGAVAATVDDATAGADLVVLAVPLKAVPQLPPSALAQHVVIDATNYSPRRDGEIHQLDDGLPSSVWVASHFPSARVVKAFNTIVADHISDLARPGTEEGRIGLPIAGDDPSAKNDVMALIDEIGFDPVDAGNLDSSWRQEPGTLVYAADKSADEVRASLQATI